jgi:hypothetical protein
MRYRLLIEYEDGSFRVMEDTFDRLKEYKAERDETLTFTRLVE